MELSLVIPTYNEKDNISKLINQVFKEFKSNKILGEILVVDDGSPDGTSRIVESLQNKHKNLKLIKRSGKLGLSSAVIDGWKIAKGSIFGVMDADLSHPVDKIHELFFAIKKGQEMAIGTRYIKGGGIKGWGSFRKFASRFAGILSKPFTKVRDPMSGFFFVKKSKLKLENLDAQGFKILLDVLVKSDIKKIKEIPIVFINRQEGKSKANSKEFFLYLKNLIKYAELKYKTFVEFIKFGLIGFLGTILNLIILYSLTEFAGTYYIFSATVAFVLSATSNYILNKVWTFKEKLNHKIKRKFVQFFIVSLLALIFNLGFLFIFTEFFGVYYIVSQLIAIILSLGINFLGNKVWTFRK